MFGCAEKYTLQTAHCALEQLWALKSIACVDNKVVSVSYLFQSVWMDLERELDLYTK